MQVLAVQICQLWSGKDPVLTKLVSVERMRRVWVADVHASDAGSQGSAGPLIRDTRRIEREMFALVRVGLGVREGRWGWAATAKKGQDARGGPRLPPARTAW